MKKILFLLTLVLGLTLHAQTTNAPRTYYEALNSLTDAPLLKGMSTIGSLNDQINFPVEVRAERLINLQNSNTVYAVSLRTKVSRITQIDYIDYDELDGLIRGVQFVSQADRSLTPLDNFEAVYRTRSGLSVMKLTVGNKVIIALKSGDPAATRNIMAPFVMDDFGRYLTAAKARLDAVAASGR